MARIKDISVFMSSLMFLVDFFAQFLRKVEKIGVSAEVLYEAMKSNEKREAMAEACANVLKSANVCILKHLTLIERDIHVVTQGFSKEQFFTSKLGARVWTDSDFNRFVKPELSDIIPAFDGIVNSLELSKDMHDSEIRAEIGETNVRTADEAVVLLGSMVLKQPNGEQGDLKVLNCANIIYVKLKSGEIVVMRVSWDFGIHTWLFITYRLGGDDWREGVRVFANS